MPSEIILQQSPDAAALLDRRKRLATVRVALAEREADLAQIRSVLKVFESRYLRQVGMLYVELDELEARILEREVDLYDSETARRRAEEARRRAQETRDATLGADQEPEEFDPPPSLRTLFREVAMRIHPDLASDETEQKHLTLLMMRANQAYSRGDTETLQRLLDDHRELNTAATEEGDSLVLLRIMRQIQHAERDISRLDGEEEMLLGSEIGQLYTDSDTADREGRDLLAELAVKLRAQIADAQYRFDFLDRVIDRQVTANGR